MTFAGGAGFVCRTGGASVSTAKTSPFACSLMTSAAMSRVGDAGLDNYLLSPLRTVALEGLCGVLGVHRSGQ